MSDPKVYIVDDDETYLRAVSRLLRASGFDVSTHPSPGEFLAELEPDAAGCVITDLRMPGMDGIALQAALNKFEIPLPVVFLSGQGDIPTTVAAMRRGAEDFLTKQAPKEELIATVQRALARDQRQRAERARMKALQERFAALSARELQVLQLVVRGQLNKQIAAALGIHERTVKLHRTSITSKLRVYSAAELATLAREAQLFPNSPGPAFPNGQ